MFLENAGFKGKMPRIIAAGGRGRAFDRFCTSFNKGEPCMLLVDGEGPVTGDSPWMHLKSRDGWTKPEGAENDHCYLMVQCMEAWFFADKPKLKAFFGQGFNENALPKNQNIETIAKDEIFNALQAASKNCKSKGSYGKGDHSFDILMLIKPDLVRKASPWADRFLSALSERMG